MPTFPLPVQTWWCDGTLLESNDTIFVAQDSPARHVRPLYPDVPLTDNWGPWPMESTSTMFRRGEVISNHE